MDTTLEDIVRGRCLSLWRQLATQPFEMSNDDDRWHVDIAGAPLESASRDRFGDHEQHAYGAQPS